MKKRILSAVMALLIASLPMTALAEEYYLEHGSVEVTADSDGSQYVSQTANSIINKKQTTATVITQTDKTTATTNTVTITAEANRTANVTLKNVNIDTSGEGTAAVSTGGAGNVTIELEGKNTVKSGNHHAGLEKNNTGSLTITDADEDGSLYADGGDSGAGIGGGRNGSGSNITISGGTTKATGGSSAAGIGGGSNGSGNNITISNSDVTAKGGPGAAGIGGGAYGSGSNITISSSEVTAMGGNNGAGIGGGSNGSGSNITISGGTTKAAGGSYGAGIGGGAKGNGSNITISDTKVTAKGGSTGAGIGGGAYGKGSSITVSGVAQIKVQGGKKTEAYPYIYNTGADIGDGGTLDSAGAELYPDVAKLTPAGKIEYYAPGADMDTAQPTITIDGTYGSKTKSKPHSVHCYRVTDKDGKDINYKAERKDGVLTVTADADFAVLTGTLGGVSILKTQGVEKLVFVTESTKSTFVLADLPDKGSTGDTYKLTHDGNIVTFALGIRMTDVSDILEKA